MVMAIIIDDNWDIILFKTGEDTDSRGDRHRGHQRIFLEAHSQPWHRPDQVRSPFKC